MSRPRPVAPPPTTSTASNPSNRPKPIAPPPPPTTTTTTTTTPLNDFDDLGSIGSFGSKPNQTELDEEEAAACNLAALTDASAALRNAALEQAAAADHKAVEILTKDEEGRVVVDTVLAMVSKSTEQMTAHEMDQFICSLPINDLFKTFDLDG